MYTPRAEKLAASVLDTYWDDALPVDPVKVLVAMGWKTTLDPHTDDIDIDYETRRATLPYAKAEGMDMRLDAARALGAVVGCKDVDAFAECVLIPASAYNYVSDPQHAAEIFCVPETMVTSRLARSNTGAHSA